MTSVPICTPAARLRVVVSAPTAPLLSHLIVPM